MSADIDVEQLIGSMLKQLQDLALTSPVMVGVLTGGVWVARRLHAGLKIEEPLGEVNINFYRDDFTRIGLHPWSRRPICHSRWMTVT